MTPLQLRRQPWSPRRKWSVAAMVCVAVAAAFGTVEYRASPIRPTSWRPDAIAPIWTSRLANNNLLANPQRFECTGEGPESIAVDAKSGDLATGFKNGDIRIIPGRGETSRTIANTHGLPLGIGFLPDSSVVIADGLRGLLHVDSTGHVAVLSVRSEGVPLVYPDGLAADTRGRYVYFTDLGTRRRPGPDLLELVEHSGTGRLLRYDFQTGETKTLLGGLQAANGVALGTGEAYVLVNETSAYRITQYRLTGPHAGHSSVFASGLPGFPDNITFNGRDRFWVALPIPRSPFIDQLADAPKLRRLFTSFLVGHIFPAQPHPRVVAFDLAGTPMASLEGQGPHVYDPVTEAHQVGSHLILGSADARCLALVTLPHR